MNKGTLFVISAPSGAGKTSLIKTLVETTKHIVVSVSYTTRVPRPGEKNGVNYHFVNQDDFMEMLTRNLFLEHAQVYDNYYGTSQPWLAQQLNHGEDVILEIDWQGAQQVRRLKPDCVGIFILPPSRTVLAQRLQKRGQDREEVIAKRMRSAIEDISHYVEYDYLVVNDDFTQALQELQTIVYAQRLTQLKQAPRLEKLITELLQ